MHAHVAHGVVHEEEYRNAAAAAAAAAWNRSVYLAHVGHGVFRPVQVLPTI